MCLFEDRLLVFLPPPPKNYKISSAFSYNFKLALTASLNAGFTAGTPWITPPDNFKTINAEAEALEPDSILNYYKALIHLRKEYPVISEGTIEILCGHTDVFAYWRSLNRDQLLVYNNLTGSEVVLEEIIWTDRSNRVIGSYPDVMVKDGYLVLRPYESIAWNDGEKY
ncbi:DUF3459 domain-containing protein [Pseudoflavonifractor sp. 60]|nr:DUF3459 domain-containing protein [Pseudoflavonifractor sp. 60]